MTRHYLVIALVLLLFGFGVESARAEKRYFTTDIGYRCEMTFEDTLVKGICRQPRNFADFYVVYIEMNRDMNRVFLDTYYPSQYDNIMYVDRQNMNIKRF